MSVKPGELQRAREKGEVSLEERIIIDQHTPPEIWLNKKGTQGWELVSVLHRRDYTEFFMKRRTDTVETLSSDTIEKEAIKLASQAEKYFAANDFDKALQSLKQLQQLVSKK